MKFTTYTLALLVGIASPLAVAEEAKSGGDEPIPARGGTQRLDANTAACQPGDWLCEFGFCCDGQWSKCCNTDPGLCCPEYSTGCCARACCNADYPYCRADGLCWNQYVSLFIF